VATLAQQSWGWTAAPTPWWSS